jgi:hypothetical protein
MWSHPNALPTLKLEFQWVTHIIFSQFTLLGLISQTIAALNSYQMQPIDLSLYISLSQQVPMPGRLM